MLNSITHMKYISFALFFFLFFLCSDLVRFSIAVLKHCDQLGEEMMCILFTAHKLSSRNIRVETQKQELMIRGHGGGQAFDLVLTACSACLLTIPSTTSPGVVPPKIGWALPGLTPIKKNSITQNCKLA